VVERIAGKILLRNLGYTLKTGNAIYEKKCVHLKITICPCGAETWTWAKADISELTAAETRFLRSKG
jgi:GTP-dependent phosphoenolpyruvate carboxykinase